MRKIMKVTSSSWFWCNLWLIFCSVMPVYSRVVTEYSVENAAESKATALHRVDTLNLMLYTILLICTVLTIWLFKHRRLRFIHETGLTLFYGLIVGLILYLTGKPSGSSQPPLEVVPKNISEHCSSPPDYLKIILFDGEEKNSTFRYRYDGSAATKQENSIEEKATFDPEVFFNVILPPIIFNAGYSLKKRHFFRNIGSILMFAILGTTVSCLLTGFIMYGIMIATAIRFTINDALLFGAIISATDPVTVLTIFNDLNVDVDLFALVFGESALNDAVSIVLSTTLEKYASTGIGSAAGVNLADVMKSIGDFLLVFFGSLGLGIVAGCSAALLTKFTKISDFPLLETSLFILMSYLSFLMAEACQLTGIVAVLFCGICQAHYTYNNLSEESQKRTKQFFEILNFLAENFIFTYIGVSMFTSTAHTFNYFFICGAFPAILIGRAAFIYPFSYLLNLCRRPKIPANHQHMLVFAGLRGAVAFALAIRNTATVERKIIYTTTSLIVIFTVLVNGGLTTQMIQWLKIKYGIDNDTELQSQQFQPVEEASNASEPSATSPNTRRYNPWDKSFLPRKWYNFDSRYLKPLLTNSRPTLLDTTSDCCLPVAKLLTTTRQMNDGIPRSRPNSANDLVDGADGEIIGDLSNVEESYNYQSTSPSNLTNIFSAPVLGTASGTVSGKVDRDASSITNGVNSNRTAKMDGTHGAPV